MCYPLNILYLYIYRSITTLSFFCISPSTQHHQLITFNESNFLTLQFLFINPTSLHALWLFILTYHNPNTSTHQPLVILSRPYHLIAPSPKPLRIDYVSPATQLNSLFPYITNYASSTLYHQLFYIIDSSSFYIPRTSSMIIINSLSLYITSFSSLQTINFSSLYILNPSSPAPAPHHRQPQPKRIEGKDSIR